MKSGQWIELDIANLAEEIEDIGKSLKRELESHLKVLLVHLLKWKYQPELRGNSWLYRIEEQAFPVLMLASPLASRISGTNLVADGALTRGVQF